MSQKRIHVQKNPAKRREETKEGTKIPTEVKPETKKKLDSSAEVIKKIEELLQEAATKTKEAEKLWYTVNYRPRIPNCEGRMFDPRWWK